MQNVEPIARLIKAIAKLPGIGEKTASRLALFILNSQGAYVTELAESLLDIKRSVRLCSVCMGFSDTEPCAICADETRDASIICVVSDFKDMTALESSGNFEGRYHILHGALAPLKGIGPDRIRIKELSGRLTGGDVTEVILATAFDVEGEATATYLAGLIKPLDIKVTRLASGVPVGSFIEYMDSVTLGRAMSGRRDF
ncbi:MAG: recombination mediator RecR [Thermodesulfobacteriota bacterium]